MTCRSSACPTAPPEANLGTAFGVEAGGLMSPGTTMGNPVGSDRSMGVPGDEVEAGTSEALERSIGPPTKELIAFACALYAVFEVCKKV